MRRAALLVAVLTTAAAGQGPRVDFERQVLPVLEKHCFDCHGDPTPKKRAKGGLRLDGLGWILEGGDGGRVLVPGRSAKSPLVARVLLPPGHEDLMPPRGERVSVADGKLLTRWVDQGARFGKWTGAPGPHKDGEAPPEPKPKPGVSPRVAQWKRLSEGLTPASRGALDRARAGMATIRPVMDESALLRVGYSSKEVDVTNETVAALNAIRKHVTVLDLRRCENVGDTALVSCGQMPNLTRLDLAQTKVTDRGLHRLTPLDELSYINLYATGVTDNGLETLAKLPSLRRVYAWKSKVTKLGAQRLQRRLRKRFPDARVVWDPGLPDDD